MMYTSKNSFLLIKLFVVVLLMSFITKDNDDCVMYFVSEKGSKLELKNYNRKGKVQNVIQLEVTDKVVSNNKITLAIKYAYYDKKQKDVQAKGNYKAMCENGVFKFEFGAMMPMAGQSKGKNMKMEIESDFLDIPSNPSVGQKLRDGVMKMKMKAEGMPNMFNTKVEIKNRKVEGMEKITTPAGTFSCVKISYNSEMKMSFMKTRTKTIEWFARGVGMVRSESYNKRGKLSGYTELTKLTK